MGHHGVDDEVVNLDFRKLLRHAPTFLDEHAVTDLKNVGLVHDAHMALSGHSEFERAARDALAANAGNAPQGHHDIFGDQHLTATGFDVAIGVKALGVFAHHDQIEFTHLLDHTGPGARWPYVGEQVQFLAEELGRIDFTLGLVLEVVRSHGAQHQSVRGLDFIQQRRRNCCTVAL